MFVGPRRALLNPPRGDPSLKLNLDFLKDAGSTIASVTVKGPVLTFTRESDARYFNESGVLVASGANDLPRFDHDPANSDAALGLLIEVARTNLQVNAEAFDNVAWTKTNLTVNADDIAAPDGNTTAERITDDTTNGQHTLSDGITIASGANTAFSVFAKAGTHDFLHITYRNANEVFISAAFDISSGSTETAATDTHVGTTSGTIVTTSQQNVGGGWFRCTLVGSVAATNGSFYIGLAEAATGNSWSSDGFPTYTGTTETAHIWGASAELGTFPLSYIPTTTVSVTRADEFPTIGDLSWWDTVKGTFVFNYTPRSDGTNQSERGYLLIGADFGNNRFAFREHDSGSGETVNVVIGNGSTVATIVPGTTQVANTLNKVAFGYDGDSGSLSSNGDTVVSSSTGYVDASAFSLWRLGHSGAGGNNYFNGHLSTMKFFNVKKPNAFLVSITS